MFCLRQSIVAILKKLRWTFVAVVHVDDNYGVMGSQMLKEAAAAAKICINDSIAISSETGMGNVVSRLVNMRHRAEGGSLAVVYIGDKDTAESLIFHVRSRRVRHAGDCTSVLLLFFLFFLLMLLPLLLFFLFVFSCYSSSPSFFVFFWEHREALYRLACYVYIGVPIPPTVIAS